MTGLIYAPTLAALLNTGVNHMGSQWEDKNKPHLNIVFIGHVDHGKSTTVGRLLLDSGHIEQHVIDKNEKLAVDAGRLVSVSLTSWTD